MNAQPRWLLLGLLATLAGCSDNGLTLGRVSGKVTYKGVPVQFGTVMFEPDTTKGTNGPSALGNIVQDGTYVMSTQQSGDGAVVGYHKVGLMGLDPEPISTQAAPDPETAPAEYMKAKSRMGKVSAVRKVETFTDRGGRTFRYVTPKSLSNPGTSGIIAKVDRGSNTVNIEVREDGSVNITN
jgi:hypothetical protein